MRTFREDLEKAVNFHGHICVGQVLGTRIARLGLQLFKIASPETYRDLIVYVEADRCLADAVSSVCHCNLGRRRLKWIMEKWQQPFMIFKRSEHTVFIIAIEFLPKKGRILLYFSSSILMRSYLWCKK